MRAMSRRALLLAISAAPAAPRLAQAQSDFPNRPLRIIVPFLPGGGLDLLARQMAEPMRAALGQPVVVENRAGAAGQIGTQAVARAAPDGYTLLLATAGEIAVAPPLYGDRLSYDPLRDLAPVTLAARIPNVLVVGPQVPARSVGELLALARANPDQLSFATGGVGNIQHLNGEMMNRIAGVRTVHVPYRGTAAAITDVAAGRVTMHFAGAAGMLPLIQEGRLRPLAVTSRTRLPSMPDLPAMAEDPALAGYELENWFGLLTTGGTPEPVVARLNAVATAALRSAELASRMLEQGSIPAPMAPAEFRRFIEAEIAKLGTIVREARITPEG
ncbi:Bug family tripartite tricarboxylate transporter substrate binding protein [Falsiroseomonas sp. CW058]|uniref:Bug family tripartite tricarboxylate transporter substrate binding protein n=1 Tax=Falsiroseomonas sp. CW058 TaxID=3388664 RepID=UPI003D319C90